jgi:hypothetical protein
VRQADDKEGNDGEFLNGDFYNLLLNFNKRLAHTNQLAAREAKTNKTRTKLERKRAVTLESITARLLF